MKRNVKKVNIHIETEAKLKVIKNTFAFRGFFHDFDSLVVGDNIRSVNHVSFSNLINSQFLGKAIVTEVVD